MNVLYLHSHDTGRYIEPYGYSVPTPNLMRFARECVLFRQAFCVNPTCSPSRAGLLTGQYDHQNGMFGLAHRGWRINDPGKHLAAYLNRRGYATVSVGAHHVWPDRNCLDQIGYEKRLGPADFAAAELTAHETAAEYLADCPERPFFLSVGFHETHRVYPELTSDSDARYVRPPEYLPDVPDTRRDMARYIKMAAVLDAKMGAVLEALRQSGEWDNTIIICTTDHGIAWPRMKCNLTDGGLGVMFMLRVPGMREGLVVDEVVSHLDVYPTLCELLDFDPPEWLEGCSIVPLLRGGAAVHEELYGSINHHTVTEPVRSVRTARYKLIRHFHSSGRPVLKNCNDGEAKSYWVDNGWADEVVPADELFDLVFDPTERRNVLDEPRYAAVVEDLRSRLTMWMERTGDPLYCGTIPPGPNTTDLRADEN